MPRDVIGSHHRFFRTRAVVGREFGCGLPLWSGVHRGTRLRPSFPSPQFRSFGSRGQSNRYSSRGLMDLRAGDVELQRTALCRPCDYGFLRDRCDRAAPTVGMGKRGSPTACRCLSDYFDEWRCQTLPPRLWHLVTSALGLGSAIAFIHRWLLIHQHGWPRAPSSGYGSAWGVCSWRQSVLFFHSAEATTCPCSPNRQMQVASSCHSFGKPSGSESREGWVRWWPVLVLRIDRRDVPSRRGITA